MALCLCGCGENASLRASFVRGHHLRLAARLRARAAQGDQDALYQLQELGWESSLERGSKFGVEAEFWGMSRREAVYALVDHGLNAQDDGYHHETRDYWRITNDGSVSNEGNELVSPVLRLNKKGLTDATKAVRALKDRGANIDASCGVHVHHDASRRVTGEIIATHGMYTLFQPVIDQIVSPSRRGNAEYLHPLGFTERRPESNTTVLAQDLATTMTARQFHRYASGLGRYYNINLNAYSHHNTLEFRQHQGTLNGTKIKNWVRFTSLFMDAAKNGLDWKWILEQWGSREAFTEDLGVTGMVGFMGGSEDLVNYYTNRAAQLASPVNEDADSTRFTDSGDRDEPDDEYYEEEYYEEEPEQPEYNAAGDLWCSSCGAFH